MDGVSNRAPATVTDRAKSVTSRRSVRSALPATHAKARGALSTAARAARPRVDGDGLSLVVERTHVVVHRVRAAEQAGDVERGDGGADEAHEDDEALARRSRARPRAPRAEAGDAAARGGGPAEGGASGGGARVRGLGRGGLRRAGTPVVLLVPPVDRPGRVVFRRRAGRSAGEGRGGRGGEGFDAIAADRGAPPAARGPSETRRTRRSRARPPPNPPRRSSRTSRPSPSRRARRRTAEGGRGVLRSIAPRRARAFDRCRSSAAGSPRARHENARRGSRSVVYVTRDAASRLDALRGPPRARRSSSRSVRPRRRCRRSPPRGRAPAPLRVPRAHRPGARRARPSRGPRRS